MTEASRERKVSSRSVLFLTSDSCRYDTYLKAVTPNLDSISDLYQADAPSHFTYASHAAMFVGFTPGVASTRKMYVNPKYGRLFKLARAGWTGREGGYDLHGRDIVDGFKNINFSTIGTAAMGWFDPECAVSHNLIGSFDQFYFAGGTGLCDQLSFVCSRINESQSADLFVFINIGETHVPYYYKGASWAPQHNPCVPFGLYNSANESALRQQTCLEYIDRSLDLLIKAFFHATIIFCGDHGDCWGEDGLWEHGISHPCTLKVPLLIRYKGVPVQHLQEA